jgi:DNA invertase Pin-like site-specific DNA recombinase
METYCDKSTGTDTDRSGYRELIDAIEGGSIDAVVVHEISRLARSLQDLKRTVSRVTDHGVKIHLVRDELCFGDGKEQPMHRLQMQMLGAFAEWQARVKQMNTREGIAARRTEENYHHGPAPLGFRRDDGQLIETDHCRDIVAILDIVQKDELSKRKAANRLGCARSTAGRALERTDLYGL